MRTGLAAVAVAVLAPLALGAPPVWAAPAPGAAPASDGQGYLDSAARCGDAAVAFGSTAASRVAICPTSTGKYEYRGVRIEDGAGLTLPATQSGAGEYTATNDGVTYTVSAKSLVVTVGSRIIREEPMLDFHGSGPDSPPTDTETPAETPADTPTPTTPLPPPLPAEEGHVSS